MMKTFKRVSGGAAAVLTLILGLAGPVAVSAATSPALGATELYGVVAETFSNSNTAPYTVVNGKACYTTVNLLPASITGGIPDVPCTNGIDQDAAKADVNGQAALVTCMNLGPAPALNATDIDGAGPLPPGTFTPGCYKSDTAMTITTGTNITLSGAGTYIFKSGGSLTTGADSYVALAGGASACDVFWAPVGGTTIGAYTGALPNPNSFVGTIFRGDAAGLSITLGHFSNLLGRALAFGSTVTTDANTITVPTCTAPPPPGGSSDGTITVVKTVINDNGRTKTVADFPLFVNSTPVVSGVTNRFQAPAMSYMVSETADPNYTRTFSGDCDFTGMLPLNPGSNKFCFITNDDIGAPVVVPPVPPLIEVVKVPSPLALPAGPGPVTYTYTLRNIGTVPVTGVTMVGDTCSPISLVSGDANGDAQLQVNETWTYRCSTTLTETHTNTVVATGWANGISASDIASATVVVGQPIVPPLIHVTKIPSPLTLLAGGGRVTYTKKVTNPGTVALSNVRLTDDKCSAVTYVSGDANGDNKLDPAETWTYTCSMNHSQSSLFSVSASGDANGLTARDLAIATVVVAAAVPSLPKTGFSTEASVLVLSVIAVALFLYVLRRKQTA